MRLRSFVSASHSLIRLSVYANLLTLLCLTPLAKADENSEVQFQRVAQRLLAAPPLGADYHRIQLYPINEYTPEVHRRLQVAANLCAAFQTNEVAEGEPIFPLVFRPLFKAESGAVYLTGFQAVTNAAFADNPWLDISNGFDRLRLGNTQLAANANIYGQPVILSVNQHWPNFNEFEVKHDLVYYRKLELIRANPQSYPIMTNIMIGVGLSNRVAVEFWNPRTNNINRPLRLEVLNFNQLTLRNEKGEWLMERSHTNFYVTNVTDWRSNQFEIPLRINRVLLTNAQYLYSNQTLTELPASTNAFIRFERLTGIPSTPAFQINATNTMVAKLTDVESGRLVDFVNLHKLQANAKSPNPDSTLNQDSSIISSMWLTNLIVGTELTQGLHNQILASRGDYQISNSDWSDYNYSTIDKDKNIDLFRVFCGLSPFYHSESDLRNQLGNTRTMVTPFNPKRRFNFTSSFQVNDPLIHHTSWQLRKTNTIFIASPYQSWIIPNIGLLNDSYSPWRGNPNRTDFVGDVQQQDPLIYRTDNWKFPPLQRDSLKGLGQIHRGTPWQSLYLKPIGTNFSLRNWERWSKSADTHPSNDYHLVTAILPEFTGLTNETRIALNEPYPELWRSVFTGITVLTNTVPTNAIVSKYTRLNFEEITLPPDMPQVEALLAKIAEKRATSPNGLLTDYGDLLNVTELSLNSPFLRSYHDYAQFTITDEAYERLTEALLERVRPDHVDLNLVIENGQARLRLREFFAAGYTVQWSSNLVDWINLTNNLPSDAVIDLEGDTAEAAQKFYRVVR